MDQIKLVEPFKLWLAEVGISEDLAVEFINRIVDESLQFGLAGLFKSTKY